MIDQDTANDAVRAATRERRFGSYPVCNLCGESDPVTFERHHAAGRRNVPDLTVLLCKNCHAKQTEQNRLSGVSMREPSTPFDALASLLAGVADFLRSLADHLTSWAHWLSGFVHAMDDAFPSWRDIAHTLPSIEQYRELVTA